MLRKFAQKVSAILVIVVMLAACGRGAPATPTDAPEIVNPPVIKETQATPTPRPTVKPEEPKVEEPKAVTEKFAVNGVTMPFNRSEAVVMDQTDFSIFDSFNPMIPNGVQFAAGYWQISNEYLWYTNYATGDIVPWLAESHEYSADYKTLKIYIRKGVTWSDGEPFTAHDVAYTMNLAMDPKYDDLGSIPHTDSQYWDKVYAADDYTVVWEMNESRPRQHLMFWCRICTGSWIAPKHIFENEDLHTFKNNPPVTTGPYVFEKAYPENKVFIWKRNENYWGKAFGYVPAPKYVVYRTGPGAEQLLAEVKENNMDIFGMSYDLYTQNKAAIPQINQVVYVDPCPRGAWFNTAKAPDLTQPEFRRAMSMLMNRPKWGENIWAPPSKPADAPWADYRNLDKYINREANEKWGILEYNPKKALELLESIGYKQQGGKLLRPDGTQVKLEVTTVVGVGGNEYLMGQDFTEDLKAIGIDATFEYVEGIFWDNIDTGNFDIGFWWHCGTTVDPTELYNSYTCDRVVPIGEKTVNGNGPRLCNPQLDAVLKELNAIDPDDSRALGLYLKAYDLWMENPPGVPLIQTYYTANFNTTYWKNMMSNDNLYTVPFNWWGQIMFVLFEIEPQ